MCEYKTLALKEIEDFVGDFISFKTFILNASKDTPDTTICSLFQTLLKDKRDREVAEQRNGKKPWNKNADPDGPGGSAPVCPEHNTAMKKSQHGGWYCPRKDKDGGWCKHKSD